MNTSQSGKKNRFLSHYRIESFEWMNLIYEYVGIEPNFEFSVLLTRYCNGYFHFVEKCLCHGKLNVLIYL